MSAKKAVAFKIPKTLGACADRMFVIREELMPALKRQLDALDEERKVIQEHVINTLPKSEASGISGQLANVRTYTDKVPQVEDWNKLRAHILKVAKKDPDAAFAFLQKRLSDGVVKELWEDGKTVPGVKAQPVVKVSLTAVKAK